MSLTNIYIFFCYLSNFSTPHYPWLPRYRAKKCKNSSEKCAKVTEPVPVLTKLSLSLTTLPEFFSWTIFIFWYPARFIFCPLATNPHIYTLHHCTVSLWYVTALKFNGLEFKLIKVSNFERKSNIEQWIKNYNIIWYRIKDCEICDLLDFCDFNTIKPFWVDDSGAGYKFKSLLFEEGGDHSVSYAHAE